jgi:hypothetical protein
LRERKRKQELFQHHADVEEETLQEMEKFEAELAF